MGDLFREQIVKKKSTTTDLLGKCSLITLCAFLLLTALFTRSFMISILIVIAVYFIFVKNYCKFKIEYEYALTNDILDVDVVMGNTKRKRALEISIKTFDVVAKSKNPKFAHEFSNVQNTMNFTSGVNPDNVYAAITSINGVRTKILFEPNDPILDGMAMFLGPIKLIRD